MMGKRLTQEEFVARAKAIHGDKYCFDNTIYVNNRTKVSIVCREHGVFNIDARSLLNGHGCQKCGLILQSEHSSHPHHDKEWLINKLESMQDADKFDYSKIKDDSFVYKGTHSKIPITCKECGRTFYQTASARLRGCGCQHCRLRTFSKAFQGHFKTQQERNLVAGWGVIDVEGNYANDRIFRIWYAMVSRCHSDKHHIKRPSYKNCTICEEWKFFSVFKKWYEEHYVEGWQLDKDLLSYQLPHRMYSPQTCCFLPSEINSFLVVTTQKHLPIGVFIIDGCIVAKEGVTYLGTFPSIEDASKAYKQAKKAKALQLANKWKEKLDDVVYNNLINLDIDLFFHLNK